MAKGLEPVPSQKESGPLGYAATRRSIREMLTPRRAPELSISTEKLAGVLNRLKAMANVIEKTYGPIESPILHARGAGKCILHEIIKELEEAQIKNQTMTISLSRIALAQIEVDRGINGYKNPQKPSTPYFDIKKVLEGETYNQ